MFLLNKEIGPCPVTLKLWRVRGLFSELGDQADGCVSRVINDIEKKPRNTLCMHGHGRYSLIFCGYYFSAHVKGDHLYINYGRKGKF